MVLDDCKSLSPQPGVFRSDLLKDRDVGVGVVPRFEEVLERLLGFRRVARQRGAARRPQIGEPIELSPIGVAPGTRPIGTRVIHDPLELSFGAFGAYSGAIPRQRASERDIIQILPVSSTRTIAIRPPAADQPFDDR